ncbi:putative ABC transporter integral membrane protein [Minicystis rosea]|nr:putative ABC transporter integral membrane protein [Minicystis rosea]
MKLAALWTLIRRDLGRTRGALVTSGFGIAAGTAALVFFLALGLGVRAVLLGDVFPIDQVELEPPKAADPGLLGILLGGNAAPTGIPEADIEKLRGAPRVTGVYPKLRFAFPSSGRGGKEIFGHDVGTSELVGDGIDPALVRGEKLADAFVDPLDRAGPACVDDGGCAASQYCERAAGAAEGKCSEPIPALVSRYLVEVFDKSIAPAHGLPPVGETLVARAQGVTFNLRLGESMLGRAKHGAPRTVKIRAVGVSKRAIDLGITLPLSVVRRWNRELAGDAAAERYSSAMVQVSAPDAAADVLAVGQTLGLAPHDTRARDVSVLISGVTGLLSLIAAVILIVSASNIAYTFRVLVAERRAEIALYRAVGATGSDVRAWMLGLAAMVGVVGGAIGLVVARLSALVADLIATRKLPDFPFKPASFFAFPPWLWGVGIAFAALFAMVGAFGPARRAAKVEPAAALSGS